MFFINIDENTWINGESVSRITVVNNDLLIYLSDGKRPLRYTYVSTEEAQNKAKEIVDLFERFSFEQFIHRMSDITNSINKINETLEHYLYVSQVNNNTRNSMP